MRHRKKGRHFSRTAEHRELMLRNLATSLFLHGRIETTVAKAKELRRFAEPLITKAKRGDLHARRLVARRIQNEDALAKLFNEIGPRFANRNGGYTRVRHLGHRAGDAADVAIIELVE
ncbi:MAG: 50S ribosomal protein L17 [bacterium]|jgi:large subunit ribosomal protein L17